VRPIVMPSMGMYTEEGVLTAWLRPAGTRVGTGEPVAEITTEKATFEIPAPEEGTLHPVAAVGTTLRVESLMGYILHDGEVAPENTDLSEPGFSKQVNRNVASSPAPVIDRTLRASPLAKRLAAQHGIDLKEVKGSGPGGRIVEADLQALIGGRAEVLPPSARQTHSSRAADGVSAPNLRRSLAERLRHTLDTAASTTLTREAEASHLVAARRKLIQTMGLAVSYDALFLKIFASALKEHPELNAIIESGNVVRLTEINIGFAVAVPGGLLVPVIRSADSAKFSVIVQTIKDLTERVRTGRLQPTDFDAGTATISNLGAHHIDAFTPILNGSQSVILGIGRIAERPVVFDGKLAIGHTCVLSLTFDHRVTDGAPAAQLLDGVVRRMNDDNFLAALAE
jgi:pyruvate dehydrogenase E2 component (dihydrolipoamide acetyltransferase)